MKMRWIANSYALSCALINFEYVLAWISRGDESSTHQISYSFDRDLKRRSDQARAQDPRAGGEYFRYGYTNTQLARSRSNQ